MALDANVEAVLKLEGDQEAAQGADPTTTIAAVADKAIVIDWISYSFLADPGETSNLEIKFGGVVKLLVDVAVEGTYFHDFGLRGLHNNAVNEAVVITCTTAATTTAKFTVGYHEASVFVTP
jgi:hypothetical protein